MTKRFSVRVDLTKYDERIEAFNELIDSNDGAFGSLANWARELHDALDNEDSHIVFRLKTERQCTRLAQMIRNFGFPKITIITEEEFSE